MSVFPTTRWTLILQAKRSPEAARAAWTQLLSTYWPPLYAFFRAKGLDATSAADAVQGLATQLLERDAVTTLSPERGRLRGFLKVSAEHFLIHEYEKQTAAKRGGVAKAIELDSAMGERLASGALSTEHAFERAWAVAVVERALAALESEWVERAGSFEVIRRFFAPQHTPPSYQDAAREFSLSIPQLKSLLHRARLRFRALLEAEVRQTVTDEAELAAEISSLLEALGR